MVCFRGCATGWVRRGLTLMELIVAIVVVSLVTAATTGVIAGSLRSAEASERRERTLARADLVARQIARDVSSVVRDGDLYFVKLLIEDGRIGDREADELLLFSRPSSQARYEAAGASFDADAMAEGSEYEVQYRLVGPGEGAGGTRSRLGAGEPGVVWRRLDPQPDEAFDGGGVVFPVASGIESVSIEAFDGRSWFGEWDSDRDGLPHAVRVRVVAAHAGGGGFVGLPIGDGEVRGVRGVAVRVASIDRVPTPFVTLAPEERVEEANESAARGGGG